MIENILTITYSSTENAKKAYNIVSSELIESEKVKFKIQTESNKLTITYKCKDITTFKAVSNTLSRYFRIINQNIK